MATEYLFPLTWNTSNTHDPAALDWQKLRAWVPFGKDWSGTAVDVSNSGVDIVRPFLKAGTTNEYVGWTGPPHLNTITAANLKIDWACADTDGTNLTVRTRYMINQGGSLIDSYFSPNTFSRMTTTIALSNSYGTNWSNADHIQVEINSSQTFTTKTCTFYGIWIELTTSSTTPVIYCPAFMISNSTDTDPYAWNNPESQHWVGCRGGTYKSADIDSDPSIQVRGTSANSGYDPVTTDTGLDLNLARYACFDDANADTSWRLYYHLFGDVTTGGTLDDPYTIDFWDFNGGVSKENLWDTATDGWTPPSATWFVWSNWLSTWTYSNPEFEYGWRVGGSNNMGDDPVIFQVAGGVFQYVVPQVDLDQDQYQFWNSGNTASVESLNTALTYTGAEGAQSITLRLRWTENATTHGKWSCPQGGFLLQYRVNTGSWTDVPTTGNLAHRSDTWDSNPNTGPAGTDATWGALFEHARTTNLGMDRLFTVNQQGGTNKVRISVAYGLSITPSGFTEGDTIEFRIAPDSRYLTPITETQTPTIDIGTAAQTINANSVADAASVPSPQIQNLLSIIDAPTSIGDGSSVPSPQVVPGQVQIQAFSVADGAAVGTPAVNDLNALAITSVSVDDVLYSDETNWVIEGNNFGATQGSSKVFLNTAATKDGNEVEQNVGSWSDTSITVSDVTVGSLGAFAPAYVLVEKV